MREKIKLSPRLKTIVGALPLYAGVRVLEIAAGRLNFRQVAIEDLECEPEEKLYDIAFGVRVGALDGAHPEIEQVALSRIAKALTKHGKLFIDGGSPLREIPLDKYR